ncbi:MAG TPA: glycosyltransferase family 4 protein [Pyrinomonadaceae bacterium]|nr:glycosyltransferase family 4 protein [Pyrinomonadaceae bacterium]
MILGLQTDTFGAFGGIPTYNRLVCRVLDDPAFAERNTVLIATDEPDVVRQENSAHPNLTLKGFGRQRVKFVKAALAAALRRDVDLVLAGHVNYAPLCLLLKLLHPGLRFGVFVYGWDVWFKPSWLRGFALRRADFLISISEYTKTQAIEVNRLDGKPIWVLPNAIDQNLEESSDNARKLPVGTRILSVGRLESSEQQKGFDTVINCLPALAEKVPSVQYFIIGSGTDVERHKALAATAGVSDRVHFLGTVDDATLQHCYQSADIFAMPSAQEGFGFVYLEAMRYAKAVVAARSGGAPEVVEDRVTGRLVEYGNEAELTQALIELCLDAEKRRELGLAGYQRLQEKFTFPQFKASLIEIISHELPPKVRSEKRFPVGQSTQTP